MPTRTLAISALAFFLFTAVFLSSLRAGPADDGGDGASRAARAGRGLVGHPAPRAVLRTLDGGRIDLGTLYGKKPVYLKFWATWCRPCLEQMPEFSRTYAHYRDRMEIVAVNTGLSETESEVRTYRRTYSLPMPIVIDDGSLGRALNLRVTPQHVVIGADGRILYVGHKHDRQLVAALEQAAATGSAGAVLAAPPVKAVAALTQGEQVRGIVLTTTDGWKLELGRTGRPQALVFFSPWCESYLRESRPATSQACRRVRQDSARLARQAGADWVGISSAVWTSAAELDDYRRDHRITMPLSLDDTGAAFAAFGIRRIPSVVLLDARGVVARILGPDDPGLEQGLRSLRAR